MGNIYWYILSFNSWSYVTSELCPDSSHSLAYRIYVSFMEEQLQYDIQNYSCQN